MTSQDRDPQEPGQAWMRGELPRRDYFALVRRGNANSRRQAGVWARLTQWIKRGVKRG